VAQYCLGGHGERGSPWGINFRDATHFGQDCAWYPSLDALVADWAVATRNLTNRWSGSVRDKVPSSDSGARAAQLNR
jgi:hypothetical protein